MDANDRIGGRLKLRDLRILLAVAETGSMAKAARQLAISQPAISKAVADLEQALHVSLFDRSPRGVQPNEYGRALIRRGMAVFDELRQGVNELSFLADPSRGELRLGAGEAMGAVLVARTIEHLSSKHPRLTFHVTSAERAGLLEALRQRTIEIAVTRLPQETEPDLQSVALHDDVFVVVAASTHRLARVRRIKLRDVINEPWALPPAESRSGILIAKSFQAQGIEPPQATVFAFSQQLRINVAAAGRFLTVVPNYLMRSPARYPLIKTLPLELSPTRRRIGLIWLKNRSLGPVADLFMNAAREVGREIA